MQSRRFTLALVGLGLWAAVGRAQAPAAPELAPPPAVYIQQAPVMGHDHPVIIETAEPLEAGCLEQTGGDAAGPAGGRHPLGAFPPPSGPPTHVGAPLYIPPQYPPVQSQYGSRPIRNVLQFLGVGCWSHHTHPYSCGSLRSELTFIFGSCRAFFSEPCMHGPPQVPMPNGHPR
jgi:hypothetical protein